MLDRRDFLKRTGVITAAAVALTAAGKGEKLLLLLRQKRNKLSKVPDTLDLADHGRMGINGTLGALNPEIDYETAFLTILDVHPVYMLHWSTMVSGVMPKYIELLPMLRVMSGSKQSQDVEEGFMKAMVKNMSVDGLIYDQALENRPWNVGVGYGAADWNEDYANMAGNGRSLNGLIFNYQMTGDRKYKKLAKKTAERMLELAIFKDDIAFYPSQELGNDFSYGRKTGWTSKEPPAKFNEGFEGATLFYMFQPLKGFTRYYRLTGDERFLDLSRKFVNLGIQKNFWGAEGDMAMSVGAEQGHFQGHFHGTLSAIRGLLDYALVADDNRLKFFCRDAYEYARQNGIHRLGIFPQWHQDTEGCVPGDMVGLSAALTLAGLGDYWDDVEQYARNGLIEAQATDMDELKRVSQEGKYREPYANWGGELDYRFTQKHNKGVLPGQEMHENVLERAIGSFGHLDGAHYLMPQMMHCCTANGNQGIYYAWEGIVQNHGDSADVNMWLNRTSPWVDVWSSLPYEGKLMVQNKGMKRISVRIPSWACVSKIRTSLNGKNVSPIKSGNRLVFDGLRGNETLQFEVPVKLETAQYSLICLGDRMNVINQYDCEFKGAYCGECKRIMTDKTEVHNWYRLFRRDNMKAKKTPMMNKPDYVHPEKIVDWMII